MNNEHSAQPVIPRLIRALSVPILLFWLALTAITNIAVPQLEVVGKAKSVSMSPMDAPSMQAMKRIGEVFQEFDSDSAAMIVLEGDEPLGDDAHAFYDSLIEKLEQDKKHVQNVQDFWGDPLTAAGAQSSDGKAAYVQLFLAGNQGEGLSTESVEAVREIVASTPAPNGVKAHVTGPAPLIAEMFESSDSSAIRITIVTGAVILLLLLSFYRSVVTTILVLVTVMIEVGAARGTVAFLAHHGVIGLSTFAVSMLTALAIAAGTDYAIFFIGRYQEARQAGEDPESAFYIMYRGTAKVVLGSGLTIAGALFCLSFTRLPYFQSLGVPCAIGMVVVVAAAVTLGPATIRIGGRFGLFDPARKMKTRGWRRVGTAVVRWPGPILAAACAVSLIGLLALPAYQANYDDRDYVSQNLAANVGYAAADRHFSQARMNPELLLIETDHDVRNSADMLVMDKVAKGVFRVPGVARVQAITRPLGTPIEHTSIPFLISMQGTTQMQNMSYMQDRMADMLKMGAEMQLMIDTMEKMLDLMRQLSDTTHSLVGQTKDLATSTEELRDHIADFDDFFRPLRNYFYWEPHCYNIPVCWSIRSVFDTLDGVNTLTDQIGGLVDEMDKLDILMPQLLTLLPPMLATMKTMRTMMLSMHSTFSGLQDQMAAMMDGATAMGKDFDAAKNDDSFYLPPEVFDNADFQRGMKMFVSPDGKAVRFIIAQKGDPASPEGFSRVDAIKNAAEESIKGTPWEGSKIYLAGTAATFKDMRDGGNLDLLIAVIATIALIFTIMLIIIRSAVAAFVIVGTVVFSLGASVGASVLVWQHILGIQLHWMVLAMAVIILLAVGSDYNLLLVSRFKEEIGAGLKTGIIRAIAGSGAVVTAAALVFALTMASMAVNDMRMMGQAGTTIGLGLIFDALVVRAFMTPSIAALLGRWFWWPLNVRTRPARYRPTSV